LIPHRIETPDRLVRNLAQLITSVPCAKFYAHPSMGASLQNFSLYIPFPETHLQVRPLGGFSCAMAQTTRSHARACRLFLGLKKFDI